MLVQFRLLLRSFFWVMVFASLCRVFFLVLNPYFFQFTWSELAQAFIYGLIYDISAGVYLHSIFVLLHFLPAKLFFKKYIQIGLFSLFMLVQTAILFFNLIDTGYFPVVGRRSGLEIFAMGKETDGLVFQYLIDYWYLAALFLLLIVANYFLYRSTFRKALSVQPNNVNIGWATAIGNRFVLVILLIIGARGSLNLMPLSTFDAARQTRAELISLVVNTPFNLIMTSQQESLNEVTYLEPALALSLFNPVQQIQLNVPVTSKRNIVLIVIESLGKEYVGAYNNGIGYTPFLDSLMQHSEVFLHAYSNGKRSIEGIPAILSGMPSWMDGPYLNSYYQGNHLQSIGYYLQQQNYDASFYHGGKNGTMSFDNYVAVSKVGAYFGLNEYPNKEDFDGHWGISDRPYLAYFADQLSKKSQPFFSAVFTLTSHHPYQLPKGFEHKYPLGTLPIHKTVGYTDDALRNFFELAKKQAWFSNTTFIITSDHSAENEKKYYQSPQGKYELPLFIFRPDKPQKIEKLGTISHIDILGLALQEVGYNKPFFSFGTAFSSNGMKVAMQYQDQYYQLIQWPYVYRFDGTKSTGLFDVASDSLLNQNLLNNQQYNMKVDSFEWMAKALIQTYNTRVIKNTSIAP